MTPALPMATGRILPRSAEAEKRKTSYVGMVFALGSWTMLFAALFFSYAVLRLRAEAWPPEGAAPLPRLLPAVNTFVLLLSSFLLARGVRPEAAWAHGALKRALWGTLGLGTLFLVLQLAVWMPLWNAGFTIRSGTYGSIFYGLTVFHALHALAGLIALACLLPGTHAGRFNSGRQPAVRVTAMFWHFVDIVWLLMFIAVYLI